MDSIQINGQNPFPFISGDTCRHKECLQNAHTHNCCKLKGCNLECKSLSCCTRLYSSSGCKNCISCGLGCCQRHCMKHHCCKHDCRDIFGVKYAEDKKCCIDGNCLKCQTRQGGDSDFTMGKDIMSKNYNAHFTQI